MSQSSWDDYFIGLAAAVAKKSKDTSSKFGAVIVSPDHRIVATGYNGFPRGISDNILSRHERPIKYEYTEHAERNAIFNSNIPSLKGCILYLSCEPSGVCSDCARAIIQTGIVAVIGPNVPFSGKGELWDMKRKVAAEMFAEAGVSTITIDDVHMRVTFGEVTDETKID